jgi:hypothetical protein
MVFFAWVFDGLDPGMQFSAEVWGVPTAVGVGLLVPMACLSTWAYAAWCVRMARDFFVEPEPITLDSGW